MSIEHDQSTRKAMRAGISGENMLRPLDEFSVTTTEKPDVPAGYWQALDKAFKEAHPRMMSIFMDMLDGDSFVQLSWHDDSLRMERIDPRKVYIPHDQPDKQ